MNYVILNGVKSDTIKGLLISSLPPISKPLMRTEVEEIDGRDGDVITKLGYAAYDKEVVIGLYGDYDVDDCIRFFDSQGTVVFSNELDKFYNYQIIEQIDFERLIRFRTATVTFHVQPFKYSAVDNEFDVNVQKISIQNHTETKNGITLDASNGVVSVSGTGYAEFYLPIDQITLDAGEYTLGLDADGTNVNACSVRLIDDIPTNDESFGGGFATLADNETVTLTDILTGQKSYKYLWIYVSLTVDFTLTASLYNDNVSSFTIINRGNTVSKPKITVYGSGTVDLGINGSQIFTIDLGENQYITIDAAQMNAYQGGIFMNRHVIGNYDNMVLQIGSNTISWTGNVQKIVVENYSRWI